MSASFTLTESQFDRGYTIQHKNGCLLIKGEVPAGDFATVTKLAPKRSVMDPDVAHLYGVNFAIGLPAALAELKSMAVPAFEVAIRHNNPSMPANQVKWLATGDRGLSSNTLFFYATGYDARRDGWGDHHPHDPSDLARCRHLLEACPELVSCLPRVAAAGSEWAALVANWDELCTLMDAEAPKWREGRGKTAKTYEFMRQLFEGANTPKEEA